MTETLAFKLRSTAKLTACITVKIRYTDFETVSKQARIPYTASDEVLITKVLHLFDKLYNKRVRLRLVGVKFSHLVPGHQQIELFRLFPGKSIFTKRWIRLNVNMGVVVLEGRVGDEEVL